jgi:transposase
MKARKVKGKDVLDKAKDLLSKARTIEELRQAQAIILPFEFGLSLSQTANIIGVSKSWASRLRTQFILAGGENTTKPSNGYRRRENMTRVEEAEFLAPFFEKAKSDGKLIVSEVKEALQTRLGRTIAQRSVYYLLHRHDWRKYIPSKQQSTSDINVRKKLKKTPEEIQVNHKYRGMDKVRSA